MNRILSLLAMLVCFAAVPAWGEGRSLTAEADSAYSKGEYAKAVELYSRVISSQGVSSGLYCNLANAYARGGDYGNAMVNYMRALKLDPSNGQARSNISYIESRVNEANRAELKGKKLSVDADSPSFFTSVKRMIGRDHLSDTWAVWALVFFLLFTACVALYVFTGNVIARKIGFFGGIACLAVVAVTLSFAFMGARYRYGEGVITGAKVKLRQEASVSAKENAVALTRGTRMEVLDSLPLQGGDAEWYKVRLNSDFVGWVDASDFAAVDR